MIELDLQCASTGATPAAADLQRWCELALRQRSGDSELTIRLVDEAEGRELNRTWRQKDYATNVLSFPADVPDEFLDIPLLGDLVICVPVVEREAAEQGKALEAHWAHLVIHGCLHLLGYDHIEDAEAEEMEALERQLAEDEVGIFLGTAHPAKFQGAVEQVLNIELPLPPALAAVQDKPILSSQLAADADALKQYLRQRL